MKSNKPPPDRRLIPQFKRDLDAFRLVGSTAGYPERLASVTEAHRNCQDIRRLFQAFPRDPKVNDLWDRARKLYGEAMDRAYLPGFWEDYQKLRQGDSSGMENVVRFLEADPIFFRTGYEKTKLIRYMKPAFITWEFAERLQKVVLHVVDTRDDRDFRAFCRLARKVDSPILRSKLEERLTSDSLDVRRRAQWVLDALKA